LNIKAISNIKNLIAAYKLIKSKPDNMTSGLTKDTLDGLTLSYLKNIQSQLKAGKLTFSPGREKLINKPGKSEKRSLVIGSTREKIVQKAVELVLSSFYETRFLDYSHGFRKNRGIQTALRELDIKFRSARYIIEADIKKAFPSISHNKLLEILSRDCQCDKTISLIKSALEAGYLDKLGYFHEQCASAALAALA
jgi:nicotine oxidoreductase